MKTFTAEPFQRDYRGRWQRGTTGNPRGRPRGSKNRKFRRKADQARAAEWTAHDWRAFYERTFREAEGGPAEKHGAAYSECTFSYSTGPPSRPDCAPIAASLSTFR